MNWGDMKAAVAAYTHRADLDAMFPVFLALAEQRIYYGELNTPKVRCAAMRQFATLADGTQPDGFLEAIKVAKHGDSDRALVLGGGCGTFSWDGATLVLSQGQAFPVDLTYYAKLATPVADTDENWLITNTPGIYLSALLVEVYRWAVDDQSAAREANNYASAVSSLVSQDQTARISGSRLQMKIRGH